MNRVLLSSCLLVVLGTCVVWAQQDESGSVSVEADLAAGSGTEPGELEAQRQYVAQLEDLHQKVKNSFDRGIVGGEAEKFYRVLAELELGRGTLHVMEGERAAARADYRRAAEAAAKAHQAAQSAYQAGTISIDDLLEALKLRRNAAVMAAKGPTTPRENRAEQRG